MVGVFEALGEPVRRRILELLAAGEQPVGGIVAHLRERGPISQPAVSQHLKVLRAARLVRTRAEGTRRFYAVEAEGLAAAQAWLTGIRDPLGPLAQPLDALATEVARGRRARRAEAATGAAAGGADEADAADAGDDQAVRPRWSASS